ncbi:MAG: hypothetical protein VKS61_00225 [Candidatus Sericytochromatia bacterium]|nr:hypothetical protein [Candidatus Sericytochromatia bacterium]
MINPTASLASASPLSSQALASGAPQPPALTASASPLQAQDASSVRAGEVPTAGSPFELEHLDVPEAILLASPYGVTSTGVTTRRR